jgi:poly(3-hydroxybutyrate) depolymerase
MERHPRLRILLCAVLVITATTVFARKHETGFLDRTVSVNGEVHRYQVYVPQDFDAKKKWPVILFLHGMGERGNDGIFLHRRWDCAKTRPLKKSSQGTLLRPCD